MKLRRKFNEMRVDIMELPGLFVQKVTVWRGVGVIDDLLAMRELEFLDEIRFDKRLERVVDGSEAELGEMGVDPLLYVIGRRMVGLAREIAVDGHALRRWIHSCRRQPFSDGLHGA